MQSRKLANLVEAQTDAALLEDAGHNITYFSEYHWRIDGIDVWPTVKKYAKNGRIKHYDKIEEVTK